MARYLHSRSGRDSLIFALVVVWIFGLLIGLARADTLEDIPGSANVPTSPASATSGNCAEFSTNGNLVDSGGTCGGGGGGGASELSDLSDVNTSTATNRNVLVADGTDFESRALTEADISDLTHTTDTNANTACSGTTTYLDGEGNCDNISSVYAANSHNHAASDTTSGTFADARISESSVTQHEAALSITESQISDLSHTTNTNAATICSGTNVYLDGEGNCDTITSGGGGGAGELVDLSDVNTSTATNRNVLVADGTDFESRALTEADISDLGSYLTSESNNLGSSVTWANVPDANITESSVTQHESALTITESQIGDLTHTTDTNANTACSGTTTYLDGEGNCDNISSVYAASSHNHGAHQITLGTFADARISESSVTQHEGALNITESQISDLSHTTNTNADTICTGSTTYLDGEGNCDDISSVYSTSGHTHTGSTISGLDISSDTNLTAGRSLTLTDDSVAADAELYTHRVGAIAFESPEAADDFQGFSYAFQDFTITGIFCKTDTGTVNLDVQLDDGSPADVNGSDITCTSSGVVDTSLAGDTGFSSGEQMDLAIASVTSSPGELFVIVWGTAND